MTFGIFGIAVAPPQQDSRVSTNAAVMREAEDPTTESVTFLMHELVAGQDAEVAPWQLLLPEAQQAESASLAPLTLAQATVDNPMDDLLSDAPMLPQTHALLQALSPGFSSLPEPALDADTQPELARINTLAELPLQPLLLSDAAAQAETLPSDTAAPAGALPLAPDFALPFSVQAIPVVPPSDGKVPTPLIIPTQSSLTLNPPQNTTGQSGSVPFPPADILAKATEQVSALPSGLQAKNVIAGLSSDLPLSQLTPVAANSVTLTGFASGSTAALPSTLATGATVPLHQWQSLSLHTPVTQWGNALFNTLQDKLTLQLGQQIQRAQIRLDPPQLGSIELRITIDGDKTSIQLLAGQPQVREAMQQTAELLRLSLGQHSGDASLIDVQVGEFSQQQRFFSEEVEPANLVIAGDDESDADSRAPVSHGWIDRLA